MTDSYYEAKRKAGLFTGEDEDYTLESGDRGNVMPVDPQGWVSRLQVHYGEGHSGRKGRDTRGADPARDPNMGADNRGDYRRFLPLVSEDATLNIPRMVKAERIEHVLRKLPKRQQSLLRAYVYEGRTLTSLASKGESRQAVQQRFHRARRAFVRAWEKHAGDLVSIPPEELALIMRAYRTTPDNIDTIDSMEERP